MDTYDLCFKSEFLKVFAHKKSEEKKVEQQEEFFLVPVAVIKKYYVTYAKPVK